MPNTLTGRCCAIAGLFGAVYAPAFAQDTQTPAPIILPTGPPPTPPITPTTGTDAKTQDMPTPPVGEAPPVKKKKHSLPPIGIDFGSFAPSDRRTRDTFGGSWTSIGFGFGKVKQASVKGRTSFGLETYSKKSGDTHAFLAPIGFEYRRALLPIEPGRRLAFIPYAGASASIVATDLLAPKLGIHSRFRFTEGGSVFLGATLGEHGFVEGRYLGIGKVRGLNFSGFSLTAGVRF